MNLETNDFGLGLDAGGTQTRWALARASGEIIANGDIAGMTALQMSTDAGVAHIRSVITSLAKAVIAIGQPVCVCAGITGLSEGNEAIRSLIANAFGLKNNDVTLSSDIEIAYLDVYAPGEGYVVYAGTGSIAAFIDAKGTLHRAGGRGLLIDDAGGGFWIATQALQHIWREEDERPGSWRDSPMAVEIFSRLGGNDWPRTREFVYGVTSENSRGEIGKLALAVAVVADTDPVARRILEMAGGELARLGRALTLRFGSRPITLAGRVGALHPAIFAAMRAALPDYVSLQMKTSEAHCAAALIAARRAPDVNSRIKSSE